jgi:signal transduction histidine kinase
VVGLPAVCIGFCLAESCWDTVQLVTARFSLRAQIAVALVFALFLGGVLHTMASMTLTRRALEAERRVFAIGLARQIGQQCSGMDRRCLDAQARAASTADLLVRLVPGERLSEAERAVAPAMPDGRRLLVRPKTPQLEKLASFHLYYELLGALLVFVVGFAMLNRAISRPIDRLADAAERIGRLELDDPLERRGPLLGRLGIAFERMSKGLRDERARVNAQIEELRRLNCQLADAKDSLVRSEKLATVGRLAAGVAHEIGNPLGAIFGFLELARERSSPQSREYLDCIDHEVARIDRTVRELLDFSRPAAQALSPLDLHAAVEAAVRLATMQKRLKSVALDVEVAEGLSVMGESHHLSQVLVNVLLNAGDAMKGEGKVVIRAEQSEENGRKRVALRIQDSGPGIPAETLPRIFDPFFTTKDPGEGTGLGLSICHRIMESFGGEIRAENAPEGGALFTLVFASA